MPVLAREGVKQHTRMTLSSTVLHRTPTVLYFEPVKVLLLDLSIIELYVLKKAILKANHVYLSAKDWTKQCDKKNVYIYK